MKKHLLDYKILNKEDLGKNYFRIVLTPDSTSSALPEMLPGQFVEIQSPRHDILLRRPISIHDVDTVAGTLTLLVRAVGNGTEAVCKLSNGDILNINGPLGKGFSTSSNGETALIGGGVGIAPLLYLAKEMSKLGQRPLLIYGARTADELVVLKSFEPYADIFACTDDGSYGFHGLVTQLPVLSERNVRTIKCCGPMPMMKAVAKVAQEKGIDCEVSLENMMACGIGACLCCVEKTVSGNRCVCTDGPVFNIKELTRVKLDIELGALKLRNPILTASGTFGYGEEYADYIDLNKLGGFIVKGTTLNPREGNDYPRMVETPSGMLNAVGLQNKGVDYFIKNIYPRISAAYDSEIIVNVSGACVEDYVETAQRLSELERINAIELNISCPNVKQGGMAYGTTCTGASDVVSAVRKAWKKHLMVKLSPNVTSIVDIAKAVEDSGADSVSLINTLMGMAVDVEHRRPYLSTVTGGLSGPAVRPIAVRMVWQVAKAVNIPVVGLGGITSGRDALEFIMAGASAIQVGTANFIDPQATINILNQIIDYCEQNNVKDINELRGII